MACISAALEIKNGGSVDQPATGNRRGTSDVDVDRMDRLVFAQRQSEGCLSCKWPQRFSRGQTQADRHRCHSGIAPDNAAFAIGGEIEGAQAEWRSLDCVVAKRQMRSFTAATLPFAWRAGFAKVLDPLDNRANPARLGFGRSGMLTCCYGLRSCRRQAWRGHAQPVEQSSSTRPQVAALAHHAARSEVQRRGEVDPFVFGQLRLFDRGGSDRCFACGQQRHQTRVAQSHAGLAQNCGAVPAGDGFAKFAQSVASCIDLRP